MVAQIDWELSCNIIYAHGRWLLGVQGRNYSSNFNFSNEGGTQHSCVLHVAMGLIDLYTHFCLLLVAAAFFQVLGLQGHFRCILQVHFWILLAHIQTNDFKRKTMKPPSKSSPRRVAAAFFLVFWQFLCFPRVFQKCSCKFQKCSCKAIYLHFHEKSMILNRKHVQNLAPKGLQLHFSQCFGSFCVSQGSSKNAAASSKNATARQITCILAKNQ